MRSYLRRRAVAWCAAALCTVALADDREQTVQYKLTADDVIAARVASAPRENVARGAKLQAMLQEAGCPQLQLQKVPDVKAPNVICVAPGETNSVILVGAHFDHVRRGDGIIDNWGGSSLLPSFLESIKSASRRHTFLFVGFTDEERGLVGSHYYVRRLGSEDLQRIVAMINLDSVGAGPTEVEPSTADPTLLWRLMSVTGTLKLPLTPVDVSAVGTSDYASFRAMNVPTIQFHSITQASFKLLHSTHDNIKALKMDDYIGTYRTVCIYLSYLDRVLDVRPRPAVPLTGPTLLR